MEIAALIAKWILIIIFGTIAGLAFIYSLGQALASLVDLVLEIKETFSKKDVDGMTIYTLFILITGSIIILLIHHAQ